MYALIQIANVFYIIPTESLVSSDVVYCKGTLDECETQSAMYQAGYMTPVPLRWERGNVLIAAAVILLIIVVGMMVVADGAGVDITPTVSSCYDLINAAGQVVGQSCH